MNEQQRNAGGRWILFLAQVYAISVAAGLILRTMGVGIVNWQFWVLIGLLIYMMIISLIEGSR